MGALTYFLLRSFFIISQEKHLKYPLSDEKMAAKTMYRRDCLKYLAVGAAVLSAGSLGLSCSNAFQEARNNPARRQEYLDSLFESLPEQLSYVTGFRYDPSGEDAVAYISSLVTVSEEKKRMLFTRPVLAWTPMIYAHIGQGRSVPVFVKDPAFEDCHQESDLLSVLVDHEAIHARNYAEGIQVGEHVLDNRIWLFINAGQFDPRVLEIVDEVQAYTYQLRMIQEGERKVSLPFQELMWRELGKYMPTMDHYLSLMPSGSLAQDVLRTQQEALVRFINPSRIK